MSSPVIRGRCPGALEPMASGDGLIVRLRITGGRLDAATAGEVADLAARHGSGEIDLGRRGNLQLRGIGADGLAELQERLAALGLVDAEAGAEAVRNVVASPLSDVDPEAAGDAFALAAELEAALTEDPALRALPAKFGYSVDDGGAFGLGRVPADVRLLIGRDEVLLRLAGDATWAASVALEDAVSAAIRLGRAFVGLARHVDPPPRRMAGLTARIDAERIFAAAGLGTLVPEDDLPARDGRRAPLIGSYPTHVGVGLPFGRISAEQLSLAATLAPADLRLTPFRALLIPAATDEALQRLGAAGLITSADDPLRRVAACPGAPACTTSEIETRDLARRLAPLARPGDDAWLAVSGCAKGCAATAAHAVTLVGRDGGIDVVLDGGPADLPAFSGLAPDGIEALFCREGLIA